MRTRIWREKRRRASGRRGEKGGFVVLVLLVLVSVLATFAVANAGALNHLKARLLLVEQQQQKRWAGVVVGQALVPGEAGTGEGSRLVQKGDADRP